MKQQILVCAAAVGALFTAACADDIIGQWEHDGRGWTIELQFEEDGKGEFEENDSGRVQKGDIEWEDGNGDGEYTVELECKSSTGPDPSDTVCEQNRLQWDCEINDDGDELDCEGDELEGGKTFEKTGD